MEDTDSFEYYLETTPKFKGLDCIGKKVNNKYTITGYCLKKSIFTLHCPVCSEDKELWDSDSIKAKKQQLVTGKIPCQCKKEVVRWSTNQYKVLIKRFLVKNKHIICHDNYEKYEKIKAFTKLRLENILTKLKYNTIVFNIIHNRVMFKEEGISSCTDNHKLIAKFMSTGSYPEGTLFERFHGETNYWLLTCPICRVDEYAKEGYCDGKFKIHVTNLGNGVRPCRCHKGYKGGEDWVRFKVKSKMERVNSELISTTGYNYSDNILYICPKGHKITSSIRNFLSSPKLQCKGCVPRSNRCGFYKDRAEELDNLYILGGKGFIKIGRSFNLKGRFINLRRVSKEDLKVLYVFKGKHKDIYHYEQEILMRYRVNSENIEWTNEIVSEEDLKNIYKFLLEIDCIEESTNEENFNI